MERKERDEGEGEGEGKVEGGRLDGDGKEGRGG